MQSVQILTLVLLALGARADRTSIEKDGFCPDLSIINCSKTCSDDASCPENLKCCQQGSKRLCVNTTQEKDGMCPLATSSSSSLNGLFSEKCDTDKDCSGNAKCCDSFCGRICVMPLKVKAGRCPVNEICPIRSRPCSQDSHCKGEKKCCSTGCGWRCVEPFLEE